MRFQAGGERGEVPKTRVEIMFRGGCPVNLQIVAVVKRGLAYEPRPSRCKRPSSGKSCTADKVTFNPPNRLAGCASRSERTPRIEMPRECPLASRSARAAAGTDLTKRRIAPPPTAIGPVHYHVQYFVWRAKARCGGHTDLAGSLPRHNHGRPTRSQDDGVDVHVHPARSEWH